MELGSGPTGRSSTLGCEGSHGCRHFKDDHRFVRWHSVRMIFIILCNLHFFLEAFKQRHNKVKITRALKREICHGSVDHNLRLMGCPWKTESAVRIYATFLVLIVLLMWWGMEDWDGLDIWSVRVWMIGCLLAEGWWWRGREVGDGVGRHGNSVLGMTWNCLVCILSGLFLGICGGTWFGANV